MVGEKKVAMPGERMRLPGDRTLPVRRSKDLIVDKVKLNRVTLISADTGSGKSSQVPQMLLEENMFPILCTQPRRLAVVAVAKRVAQERGCLLGDEVGYHIGQLNVSTTKSKIVFETAGILLEELRVNGMAALARYKVVILDEVHERSVESDMVLTCVKQLMLRNPKIRLVLMSATADFKRYEEYFSELGREERVERIYIANLAATVQSHLLQTKVKYLENAVEQLGNRPEHVGILDDMTMNRSPAVQGTDIGGATLNLIRDLVVQFHATEPDISKGVLVFLPTYRSLEQQWVLLRNAGPAFSLFVLHSSIDIEHSVKAMEIACNKKRKVILATNVAESSVTIPGVSYVVDSCRSLEIYWDRNVKHHAPRLVWISQSQADQRKGRTGRTCDGTVVRLVTRQLYHGFPKNEMPQMQLFSLRKQVLMITSAESKAINDPILLLQKCINPPDLTTVTDALEFLEKLQAVVASPDKGRHAYHPSKYGELLVSLPLSLESAIFVVRGGIAGYVRESIILGAIMDTTPFPIIQPFGQAFQYRMHLEGFYRDADPTENGLSPSRTSVLLANLCAFEFWQRTFKDKHRLENLEGRIKDARGIAENHFKVEWGSLEDEELEQDWCIRHNLSLSALRAVAETADITMEKIHHYRPEFICGTLNVPSYYTAENASHNCSHTSKSCGPKLNFLSADDVDDLESDVHITCGDWPFVNSGTYHSTAEEKGVGSLIMEVQGRQHMGSPIEQEEAGNGTFPNIIPNIPPQCSYYRQGLCTRGNSCPFSHSILAKPVPCKFYQSFSGCRYGNECRFSHDAIKGTEMFLDKGPVLFEEIMPSGQAFVGLIPDGVCEAKVLLLGEGNFTFAEGLAAKISPDRIIATSIDRKEDAFTRMPGLSTRVQELTRLNVQVEWGVDATNLVEYGNTRKAPRKCFSVFDVPWESVGCLIWNFPYLGVDDDLEGHKLLMRDFFASVAITLLKKEAERIPVMLTLCNDQFGRWQVERAARESFLFLRQSIPFDTYGFGAYRPMRNNAESSFEVQRPVTYVFQLCRPSETFLRTQLEAALAA
ncbi:hypothetical protein M758_12G048900 [Ceratodon purpureus]|uniref:RNA helicase n=1 Tax=Ceratodon purpureus TaxID=3225 RepID=A0A8T0G3T0_CERPU|nr:hypothetical protein KC19_12G046200 [Ceratodon purpureus]KAG0598136.1 hypothetical protein M758_12G048900 [Ceratodon purpureus]